MKVTITKADLKGSIKAMPSKSSAHRALICSELAENPIKIDNLPNSKDIEATSSCLKALNSADELKILDCGESGSTLRFLLPVAPALKKNVTFKMHGRLPERPLFPLDKQLENHGCTLKKDGDLLHVSGKLTGGIFNLPGDVSSQFVTGLLLALPLLDEDSEIHIEGVLESKPYVDMTADVQKKFGVYSKFKDNIFYIKGNQKYSSPKNFTVEGDWSNGAFWLSAGKLTAGKVECTGLDPLSAQGDKEIINILKNLPCTVDARDIPDLIPIVSAVASVTKGETRIINAKRLTLKESDRLLAIYNVLSELGADISRTADGLIINGKEKLMGSVIDSYNDHRIAMMAAIIAIKCEGPVTITLAEAVKKSYPLFWEDYKALGGKIKEEL
ncbi:MAG: 3-phosphoshikimate 1-carboxyvinyltransferase [Clostridia bacterium]|nr:3-phosphoshikimate 1-carboxyvinyltransferase [Clostridia bacterium]